MCLGQRSQGDAAMSLFQGSEAGKMMRGYVSHIGRDECEEGLQRRNINSLDVA